MARASTQGGCRVSAALIDALTCVDLTSYPGGMSPHENVALGVLVDQVPVRALFGGVDEVLLFRA